MSLVTEITNSCRKVEHTLWLTHSDEYSYINAYNLGYLSRLAYSMLSLDKDLKHEFDFSVFINKAQQQHTVCHMEGNWQYYKLTKIKDDGGGTITHGLTPFIQLVDIGKGIRHDDLGTGSVEDKPTSTAAFFYVDETRAVISVRGTFEKKDWLIDGDAKQIKPDFNIKGELHRGFYTQAETIIRSDKFIGFVDSLNEKELYVTGHSLGGAVATILSAYLFELGFKPLLYTYGSPRVGNSDFARYYSDK
ncbi:lipase family protein, partial [Actinobacillus vicugnae]|uniref:lipase family protein n=1 Tax=Actinobacillus vicugnae TaxID=2573093 RepID=UPI00124065B3